MFWAVIIAEQRPSRNGGAGVETSQHAFLLAAVACLAVPEYDRENASGFA
jgi:hypothetical protein